MSDQDTNALQWITSNMEDETFDKYFHKLQHEVAVTADKVKSLKKELDVFTREAEMRFLAGGFENLKMFRNRANLSPEQRKELLERLADSSTFDLNKIGTVTGRLSAADKNLSNAPKSLPVAPSPQPGVFFLNEAHELPRTTKSQVRRDKKADKLQNELDLLKCNWPTTIREKKGKLKDKIESLEKRIQFLRTPKEKK